MAAVRYYSRSGNTKMIAEAMAKAAGVEAVSVDQPGAAITEETDVLFIGGALYAYGLDQNMKDYLDKLDGTKIKKAAVFSTSWISKHALALLKKGLQEKGVAVEEETFYVRSKPNADQLAQAEAFAKKFL